MSLLYYIPGIKSIREEDFPAHDLGYAFPAGCRWASCEVLRNGPDGDSGLVARGGDGKGLGYYPDRQTWAQAPAKAFWIGRGRDVDPVDLEASEVIAGHPVMLEDGHKWMIPVARSIVRGTQLPQALVLGPEGELVREALPRYASLCAKAEALVGMHDALQSGEFEGDPFREMWDAALEALSLNYRVTALEVSFLRLLTTTNVVDVCSALLDGPAVEAVEREIEAASKKNGAQEAPDGSSSSDGGAD